MNTIFKAAFALVLFAATAFAQPAAIQRNPWTINVLPQVSAGTNIHIATNAGHKLVISWNPTNVSINGYIRDLNGNGTNLALIGDGATALSVNGSAGGGSTTVDITGGADSLALNVQGGGGTMALPTGGGVSIAGGDGAANFSGNGGALLFVSGNGGVGAIAVDMVSPGGVGGDGGAFAFASGQGNDGGEAVGDQVAGDGGTGAGFSITAGAAGAGGGGSAANPGGVGGNGGAITLTGGALGAGGADGGGGAGANGIAGTITINGGTSGATNATVLINTSGGSISLGGVNYKWPTAQGAAGTFLTNNGAGVLTWATLGSSADATKIAIIGGGGTNNTFTNAMFTNVTATGIAATFMQGPGLTNDILSIGSGGTNRWRITATGLIGSVQDSVGVIGASVSGSVNRILSVNALRIRAADSRVSAYGFVTEAGFGTLSSMDSAGFGTVRNRAFTVYNTTSDQSGAGLWSMFHWTNSGTFTFLTNVVVSGSVVSTNPIATNILGGFNDIRTNVAPYAWTNFAVASANGITTNDARRSLLRGQMKFTLGAINDVAEIIFTVTNGASVYSITNGMDTAIGAAGARVSLREFIGPTNTFEIKTNVSGTGTAVINNMTMEPF